VGGQGVEGGVSESDVLRYEIVDDGGFEDGSWKLEDSGG
jgi:hypothetical protein